MNVVGIGDRPLCLDDDLLSVVEHGVDNDGSQRGERQHVGHGECDTEQEGRVLVVGDGVEGSFFGQDSGHVVGFTPVVE